MGKPSDAEVLDASDVDEDISDATLHLAQETLTGDLRDQILALIRDRLPSKGYNDLLAEEKGELVSTVRNFSTLLVAQALEILASDGRRSLKAILKRVTNDGDSLSITMSASKTDEARHALFDATKQVVMIVLADPAEYDGERAPVVIPPDQQALDGLG